MLQKGKIGETYCIGAQHEELTNLDVVKKIIRLLGKDESVIEYVKDRPGHDVRYAMDWTKINKELGWIPEHDFDYWLEKTVNWYKKNHDWWKHVKSGEYRKYYKKQYGGR